MISFGNYQNKSIRKSNQQKEMQKGKYFMVPRISIPRISLHSLLSLLCTKLLVHIKHVLTYMFKLNSCVVLKCLVVFFVVGGVVFLSCMRLNLQKDDKQLSKISRHN